MKITNISLLLPAVFVRQEVFMCDIFKTFPFVLVTFSFPFNARLLLLREHNYEFCCQSVGRKVPVLLLSSLAFLCFDLQRRQPEVEKNQRV